MCGFLRRTCFTVLITGVKIRTKHSSYLGWRHCVRSVDMNAEVGFLVFVLYFYLFLDLFSSFEKLLCANENNQRKKSWRLQRNFLPRNKVRRKEMANCTNMRKDERTADFPEIPFGRERLQPPTRENERMISFVQQKSRLWGRG